VYTWNLRPANRPPKRRRRQDHEADSTTIYAGHGMSPSKVDPDDKGWMR
jgi:hypothetical protein